MPMRGGQISISVGKGNLASINGQKEKGMMTRQSKSHVLVRKGAKAPTISLLTI